MKRSDLTAISEKLSNVASVMRGAVAMGDNLDIRSIRTNFPQQVMELQQIIDLLNESLEAPAKKKKSA